MSLFINSYLEYLILNLSGSTSNLISNNPTATSFPVVIGEVRSGISIPLYTTKGLLIGFNILSQLTLFE